MDISIPALGARRVRGAMVGLVTIALTACDPETILGSMGVDTARIAADLELEFPNAPTPEEFAATVKQFDACRRVPAMSIAAAPTELRLVDVSETYRSGPVSATISLPLDMRVLEQLSHSNAAWWKREPREAIAFWGSTGQGRLALAGDVLAEPPCWDHLAGHLAYRMLYVAPHQSDGQPPVHMAFGQVVFRQGVGVMWGAWAPSLERLDQLLPIIYSLRLR